jgi:hypothetical protein
MHTLAEISKDNKLLAVYLLHLVELMALHLFGCYTAGQHQQE